MGDVINLYRAADSMEGIKIKRTEEFKAAANELSECIKRLSLSREENDKLVELMVKQVQISEQAAFKQGMQLGIEATKAHMEGKL